MSIDPAQRSYVSYIDKSREFYSASGYTNPYQWAYDPGTPAFTALRGPLSQLRVGLVTTTYPMPAPGERLLAKSPYAQPVDPKPDAMFTEDLFWDKNATHTRDTESFLPITRLQEQVAAGARGEIVGELDAHRPIALCHDGRPQIVGIIYSVSRGAIALRNRTAVRVLQDNMLTDIIVERRL